MLWADLLILLKVSFSASDIFGMVIIRNSISVLMKSPYSSIMFPPSSASIFLNTDVLVEFFIMVTGQLVMGGENFGNYGWNE